MLSGDEYIRQSLALHLFYARIMKEHSFFLEIAFRPKDSHLTAQADNFRRAFDGFLSDVTALSNGVVCHNILNSGEIVSPYTLQAEQASSQYTGVQIPITITQTETGLTGGTATPNAAFEQHVYTLNENATRLISGLIQLKTAVLNDILACKLFMFNYPLMTDHDLREAKLYLSLVQELQSRADINLEREAFEQESFWNKAMWEHTVFIRGLLDPTENDLIISANQFSGQFSQLVVETGQAMNGTIPLGRLTIDSLNTVRDARDFIAAGVQGILHCRIKSLILPLLADHVLRESNYYLRLLSAFQRA